MVISLDYDATFTRDPSFWLDFINLAEQKGHKVICVTKREPVMGTPGLDIETVFTSRKAKIRAGVHVDIWIDDGPDGILYDDGQQP